MNVYDYIKYPTIAKVDKAIDINKFLNPKNLTEVEKEIFKNVVKDIKVKYMLNTSTTELNNKITGDFNYQEIIVLEVIVNNPVSVYDVAIVVGRAIFYPTMLFVRYDNRVKIGFIKNAFGKNNYDINVVKDIMFTGWINEKRLSTRTMNVLDKISFDKIIKNNFYDTYNNYCKTINEYKAKYVSLENAIDLLNEKAVKPIPNLKMKLKLLCVEININNKIKGAQIYKSSRIDKYIDDNYNYTLLCVDDLYSYIESSKEFYINNYNTLLSSIKYHYRSQEFDIKYKNSICNMCIYFNGYCCENTNVIKKTKIKNQCNYFERR